MTSPSEALAQIRTMVDRLHAVGSGKLGFVRDLTAVLDSIDHQSGDAEKERERIRAIWTRFREWQSNILHEAAAAGHPWKEPFLTMDDDAMPVAEWFGKGPQGSEPARMGAGVDPKDDSIFCFVTADEKVPEYKAADGLACYLKYLELNGWLREQTESRQEEKIERYRARVTNTGQSLGELGDEGGGDARTALRRQIVLAEHYALGWKAALGACLDECEALLDEDGELAHDAAYAAAKRSYNEGVRACMRALGRSPR